MERRHPASEHVVRFEGRAAARVSRDLSFLRDLFDVLVDGCRGATRLRVTGRSEAKGPLPPWLAHATEIEVRGRADDALELHAVPLRDLFGSVGTDVFAGFQAQQTCLDLFEESLDHASHSRLDSPLYDASLVRTLTRLRRLFEHGVEKVEILNGRSFVIEPQTIEDLKDLDRRTPADAQVTMTGELRFIDVEYRTLALTIADAAEVRGTIEAAVIEKLDIPGLIGRRVLIEGLARYRPSGRLHRVDVHRLELAGETASLRSRIRRLVEAGDIEAARRLVTAAGVARTELGDWPDLLALPVTRLVAAGKHDDLELNRAWIEQHRKDYAGRWVALRNGVLKGAAPSLRELKAHLLESGGSLDVFCARVDEQAPAAK